MQHQKHYGMTASLIQSKSKSKMIALFCVLLNTASLVHIAKYLTKLTDQLPTDYILKIKTTNIGLIDDTQGQGIR